MADVRETTQRMRQALGLTPDTALPEPERGSRESASLEWRAMMATVHAQDPQRKDIFPVEADGPAATVAPVGSDKMTQLSSVYDQMHCPL